MTITDSTPPPNWFSELLQRRYGQKNEGRINRQPIGFDFTREPFDPSSYYKQIGSMRDISRAATNVVNVEVMNRLNAEREREQAMLQEQMRRGLSGIQPGFTYDESYSKGNSSRGYGKLGVLPHVAEAARFFGNRHGISNIGGYRKHGSVPNSDHPKRRALDFMTRNMQQGHRLAGDVISNASKWRVSYVIWNRAIWTPGRGWRKYSGPSPHTDHVHVSFFG